eukprot:TRINITY_DN9009_c0_g1_i1.p1 TRINITY_DN9009_c0_g1~~TRINITY_DN9009_c0_g1_i1.p1  ORF type:complete len:247 (+),score=43.84 TRINITY_DN9009_c0_g1_i1:134-874(+)
MRLSQILMFPVKGKRQPWEILNVHRNATKKEIRTSYLKLVKKYHPDMGDGDKEKFVEVQQAFEDIFLQQKLEQEVRSRPSPGTKKAREEQQKSEKREQEAARKKRWSKKHRTRDAVKGAAAILHKSPSFVRSVVYGAVYQLRDIALAVGLICFFILVMTIADLPATMFFRSRSSLSNALELYIKEEDDTTIMGAEASFAAAEKRDYNELVAEHEKEANMIQGILLERLRDEEAEKQQSEKHAPTTN